MQKYLLILAIVLICGCGAKPGDVPQLYPCQVTVTNGADPISDVNVVLGLTSESSACSMSGTTNSSGIATIYTVRQTWRGGGAPAGDYIVTLSKFPELENGLSPEELQKLDPAEQERYQLEQQRKYDALPREVPVELGDFTKSPHRMTVSKGGDNRLAVDLTKKPE